MISGWRFEERGCGQVVGASCKTNPISGVSGLKTRVGRENKANLPAVTQPERRVAGHFWANTLRTAVARDAESLSSARCFVDYSLGQGVSRKERAWHTPGRHDSRCPPGLLKRPGPLLWCRFSLDRPRRRGYSCRAPCLRTLRASCGGRVDAGRKGRSEEPPNSSSSVISAGDEREA